MITSVFGLSAEQTTQVLDAACRAPSLHNSQPWAFRLTPDRIELYLDPDRRLPVSDPHDREARLACGAALFNLRLSLARHGVRATAEVTADGSDGPLAVVERGGDFLLTPERAELERAIGHRRTNRRPFFDDEVPAGHRSALARAAESERADLRFVTEPLVLERLAQLAASAHRTQQADPAWRAEWARWTGQQGAVDGVPTSAAGPPPSPSDRWTRRDFGRIGRPDRLPGKDFEEQPLVAVLCSQSDQPRSQVLAGQAMEKMLLQATALGLAASFVSQLIEVDLARHQVADLVGDNVHPQAVLRIGFGGPVPSTPRRAALDCLMPEPAMPR